MKYFKYLLIGIIFLPNLVTGQVKHEFKINIGDLVDGNIVPAYELIINKIGIEFESGFIKGRVYLNDTSNILYHLRTEENYFDRTFFRFGTSIKYYAFPKGKAKGFYLGPHFRINYLTYIDKEYQEKWIERFNSPVTFRDTKGYKIINYGIDIGYKFLFKSHFTIDLNIIFADEKEIAPSPLRDYGPRLSFLPSARIGYRL